jgi:hypothetical protein
MCKLNNKLLELTKRIEEVRDMLNEACVTSNDEKNTLLISQCLDDLIVEYFKTIEENKENNK